MPPTQPILAWCDTSLCQSEAMPTPHWAGSAGLMLGWFWLRIGTGEPPRWPDVEAVHTNARSRPQMEMLVAPTCADAKEAGVMWMADLVPRFLKPMAGKSKAYGYANLAKEASQPTRHHSGEIMLMHASPWFRQIGGGLVAMLPLPCWRIGVCPLLVQGSLRAI